MPSKTLSVVVTGDASSIKRMFSEVERGSKRMGDHVDRQGKRLTGFATVTTKGFGRVGIAAKSMAAVGTGASALLVKSFVEGASDINESLSKNQVLFGKYSKSVDQFSRTSAKTFGISRTAALEYTGVFGNLFRALDVSREKSAKFSTSLTKLAADMASFNNTSIEDALEAIRSGLVGETEPLRRFGVNLNDAQLRQEAMALGLTKTTKNVLTPYQRAMAAQALIVKQTSAAHGDFQRTSGGLANQQRILAAQAQDTAAKIGKALIPAALTGVKAINSLFNSSSRGGRAIATIGRTANQAADVLKGAFRAATQAVSRFVDRNSDEIHTAGVAFRNLGKAAQYVFTEVILPVIRSAVRAIIPILDGLKDTLSGLVRFVTNVLAGRWGKAWDALKDTVAGAFRTIRRTITGAADVIFTAMKAIGRQIVKGIVAGMAGLANAVKDAAVGGVKKGLNLAKNAIGGAAKTVGNALNPFGDGIGRAASAALPPGGGAAGSLMGASNALAPFAGIGARFGLSVSSGRRPGAVTVSGNTSYHASGNAIDEAGSPAGMLAYFNFLKKNYGSQLRELIYTPGGVGIKDGRPFRYTGAVAADHFDHVHVAYKGPFGDGLGRFSATSYGPPWGGIQGTGTTATGVNLHNSPHIYGVAVDPSVIPLGSKLKITPNPFNYSGTFTAFDTGGAIKGRRIDFYDWRGRQAQYGWGQRSVSVSTASGPSGGTSGSGGGGGGAASKQSAFQRAQQAARKAHGQAYRGAVSAAIPTAQDLSDQAMANADIAEASGQGDVATFIRSVQWHKELDTVNRQLRRKGLSAKKRTSLLQKKAELLQNIGGLSDTASADSTDTSSTDVATDTTDWAAELAQAIKDLKATMDADVQLRQRIFQGQSGQIMAAIADMVSGQLGGRVGLGIQTPGFAGGGVRY